MNCFLVMSQGYKDQGGKEILKLKNNAVIALNAYVKQKEVPNREIRIWIF